MNPMETEWIQIPKSHFQSMNARLHGVKNLIRIHVAKENELEALKRKYKTMEAKHSEEVQEFLPERLKGLSLYDSTQTAAYHRLPLPNTCTKQACVSEETYYDLLQELCHAESLLCILRKTSDKPLRFESSTQTDETSHPGAPTDTSPPESPTDTFNELVQNNRALQERMKKQESELESLREKNADLSNQLEKEKSAKRYAVENEKKSSAKLKRELELHNTCKQEIQKLKQERKAKEIPKNKYHSRTCSSEVDTAFLPNEILEIDCGEEDTPPPKQCKGCQKLFSTDKELEYHIKICPKLK